MSSRIREEFNFVDIVNASEVSRAPEIMQIWKRLTLIDECAIELFTSEKKGK